MASITEASIIPPDPTFSGPLNYELVETDGVPLDSLWQQMQIGMLVNLTYTWVGDRQDYFAGGNQFIYYSKTRDRTTDFRGPDFYFVDKVPRRQVQEWESQFLRYMHEQRREVVSALRESRKVTPEIEKQLSEAITTFGLQFKA